jgi:hypothetical protein
VASDRRASGYDVFTLSANGETAGSYTTDGRWNRGGWATYALSYPLRNEPAFSARQPYSPSFDGGGRR